MISTLMSSNSFNWKVHPKDVCYELLWYVMYHVSFETRSHVVLHVSLHDIYIYICIYIYVYIYISVLSSCLNIYLWSILHYIISTTIPWIISNYVFTLSTAIRKSTFYRILHSQSPKTPAHLKDGSMHFVLESPACGLQNHAKSWYLFVKII